MNKWYLESGHQDDIVISTRIRLARNIKNIPFPSKMSEADGKKVVDTVEGSLSRVSYGFEKISISELDDTDKNVYIEEYYLSPKMLKGSKERAMFISQDGRVSIMANEEDHLRIQCMYPGFEPEKAYDVINKTDDCISETIQYAYSEKYGFLTSCLTNLGTGMRISFMVHLPALVKTGMAKRLFAALSKMGIAVRGIYGEGTDSKGDIFQISNQKTLGETEEEIIKKMSDIMTEIISKERELRNTIVHEDKISLENKIMRAMGTLRYATLIDSNEMMECLSYVRLGASLGIIQNTDNKDLTRILIELRPYHIAKTSDTALSIKERDAKRAKLIKEYLK